MFHRLSVGLTVVCSLALFSVACGGTEIGSGDIASRSSVPVAEPGAENDESDGARGFVRDDDAPAICDIMGGAGAQLTAALVTREVCAAACAAQQSDGHPNLSCLWRRTDITPTDRCLLVGGGGRILLAEVRTRGQCVVACRESHSTTNPNLDCRWGAVTITPVGVCNVVSANGTPLANASESRGACAARCASFAEENPNRICNWDGKRIDP